MFVGGVAFFIAQISTKGGLEAMSTYSLQELLGLWAKERLTVQQAIGHLIQCLIALEKRISQLERPRN